MNIVEAIKSGKRFKRSTDTTYRDSQQYHYKSDPAFYLLHIEDILADDWEVEEVSCYAGFQGLELPLSSRKETA